MQDLTSDIDKLHRALDDVRLPAQSATMGRRGGTPPINNSGVGSTAMFDSIYSVSSDLLRREAGRRVIILMTDGADTSSSVKMREAIERTWRSEIIVYAIGIGGPDGRRFRNAQEDCVRDRRAGLLPEERRGSR